MARILILEDEDSVNRGISFSLEKAGHKVVSCGTIQEAKQQAAQSKPEIVICDINLPDGNGLEFIQWLREESNAYVICLTALDQEMDQVMGYEAGADDYMTKPFSLSVLLLKIEVWLKRNGGEREQKILQSGTLCIDLEEMQVKKNGEEISLTKNEWKMLNYFLKSPKQVLSKQQILEHVFDVDGEFIDENTLAVYIRRLREKIEENPAKPSYIKNVRGLGYVWNEDVI